jgi:pimeloyl-ACP methyl ester carboxylesterase
MGNNRGTYYSNKHATLDPKSKEYWDFDFEEMGLYDQPAMIDFIIKTTGQEKITYMGHSEGTT